MTTAAPVAVRPRQSRRRTAMVVLSMLLAGVFVVQPAAQARAVLPVIFIAAATAARSVLPTVAARLAPLVFTTPLRGALISRLGVTTAAGGLTTWGRLAVNTAGMVGIGATGVGLGQLVLDRGHSLELGVGQEALDAMNGYVRTEAGTGSIGTPLRADGSACWFELEDLAWSWNEAQGTWNTVAKWRGGVVPGGTYYQSPYTSWTDATRLQQCATPYNTATQPSSRLYRGEFVNVVTGATGTGAGNIAHTRTNYVESGLGWSMTLTSRHTATGDLYPMSGGWHLRSFGINVGNGNQHHPTPTVWQPFVNPFDPAGAEVGQGVPDGTPYYGTRHCESSLSETQNLTVQSTTGIPIPPECPEGFWSQGYTITQGAPGAPGSVELFAVGTNPGWNLDENGANRYPGCANPDGSSTGICELSVTVDGRQCAYGVVGCAGWMELSVTAPDRVVCYWGPHRMPATDCGDMQHAYKTPYGVGVPQMVDIPAEDWTPIPVQPGQEPAPGSAPVPIVDPGGNPWPDPWANPPPSTDPGGAGTVPLTGTQPIPASQLQDDPQDLGKCLGGMWTWNPVDWAFTPMKCALQWAFTPSPLMARQIAADMSSTVQGTTALRIATSLSSLGSLAFTPGGCQGPHVVIPGINTGPIYDGYPLSACEAPMSGMASASQIFVTIGAWLGCALACGRHVAGIFGYGSKPGGESS